MHYTDEHYEQLKAYEPYFLTAIRSQWARGISSTMMESLRRIYERTTGRQYPWRGSCNTCQLHLLQDAGALYFADKAEREALSRRVVAERPADGKTPAPKKINVKRAKKAEKKEKA